MSAKLYVEIEYSCEEILSGKAGFHPGEIFVAHESQASAIPYHHLDGPQEPPESIADRRFIMTYEMDVSDEKLSHLQELPEKSNKWGKAYETYLNLSEVTSVELQLANGAPITLAYDCDLTYVQNILLQALQIEQRQAQGLPQEYEVIGGVRLGVPGNDKPMRKGYIDIAPSRQDLLEGGSAPVRFNVPNYGAYMLTHPSIETEGTYILPGAFDSMEHNILVNGLPVSLVSARKPNDDPNSITLQLYYYHHTMDNMYPLAIVNVPAEIAQFPADKVVDFVAQELSTAGYDVQVLTPEIHEKMVDDFYGVDSAQEIGNDDHDDIGDGEI